MCACCSFVGVYMGCICLYRLVFRMDHKLSYWVAGWFASLSLLIERKSRRSGNQHNHTHSRCKSMPHSPPVPHQSWPCMPSLEQLTACS